MARTYLVELLVERLHETENAYLVTTGAPDEGAWVPKALVDLHPAAGGIHELVLPQWLAEEKGFA